MKKLLKEYNLTTNEEYYDMVQESYINGQLKQAQTQFYAMPALNQKEFIRAIEGPSEMWNFFFNLL